MPRRAASPAPAGSVPRYYDRGFDDRRHDPYEPRGKLAEPTVCRECGAVFLKGRWQWSASPVESARAHCAACRRIADRMPAGCVILEGEFFAAHHDEVLQLARNEAGHEEAEHPQNRLMYVEDAIGRTTVACTDIHLPQRIGKALQRAYKGDLSIRFGEDEYSVRVVWRH